MKEYGIPCLVPPGLKDIKAVELYTKYRQFLPEEDKYETCLEPPDSASKRVKATKKRKEVAVGKRPARALQKTKNMTAKQPTKANKDPKDPTQPNRPATAYIFFCKAKHHTSKAENPDMTFRKVSKLCGEVFKPLPDSEHVIYTSQKEADKERYDAEMATWLLKKSASASVGTASAAVDTEATETDVVTASAVVDTQAIETDVGTTSAAMDTQATDTDASSSDEEPQLKQQAVKSSKKSDDSDSDYAPN
jgi:hypothetical protein